LEGAEYMREGPILIEGTIKTADETDLSVTWCEPASVPRALVVMVHGFSSHSGLYADTTNWLVEQGFSVATFDCRGHGKSEGRRGYVRRFSDYREDLALVVKASRDRHPALPWVLFAHSQGATIAIDYTLNDSERPNALVLLCPFLEVALKVPTYKLALSKILNHAWPTLALSNEIDPAEATRVTAAQERIASDPLVHHVATARWFAEVTACQTRIQNNARSLSVPSWLGVAGNDRIVRTDTSLAFARSVGDTMTVAIYPEAFHELLLDPVTPQVHADIATWMGAQLFSSYNSGRS